MLASVNAGLRETLIRFPVQEVARGSGKEMKAPYVGEVGRSVVWETQIWNCHYEL